MSSATQTPAGFVAAINFADGAIAEARLDDAASKSPGRSGDIDGCWVSSSAGLIQQGVVPPNGSPSGTPWGPLERSTADAQVSVCGSVRLDDVATLRAALTESGSVIPDRSTDLDLIAAAYSAWGAECGDRLVGDFAFVVLDPSLGRVVAVRDPMGARPLYYRAQGDVFACASEVAQLLAAVAHDRAINRSAVVAYLAGEFPSPDWAFYDGVSQLAPGHTMVVTAGELRTFRHWEAPVADLARSSNGALYEARFRDAFVDAVSDRLPRVGRLGVMLSGGVDSGCAASVAGWLDKAAGRVPSVAALGWAFDELQQGDERSTSDLIVRHFGMEPIDVPADDAWPLSARSAPSRHHDDPIAVPFEELNRRTLEVARSAGVTRVMTGHRGDEAVGDWIFDFVTPLVRMQWVALARELAGLRRTTGMSTRQVVGRHLTRPIRVRIGHPPALRRRAAPLWIRREVLGEAAYDDWPMPATDLAHLGGPVEERYHRIFGPAAVRWAMVEHRRAAGLGLDVVAPWADRRVAECLLTTPPRVVQRGGEPKRIALRALAPMLAPGWARQAQKTEPHRLYDLGLREREADRVARLLKAGRAEDAGFIDSGPLLQRYSRYLDGGEMNDDVFRAVSVELWLREHW